jgi:hypothetical protein
MLSRLTLTEASEQFPVLPNLHYSAFIRLMQSHHFDALTDLSLYATLPNRQQQFQAGSMLLVADFSLKRVRHMLVVQTYNHPSPCAVLTDCGDAIVVGSSGVAQHLDLCIPASLTLAPRSCPVDLVFPATRRMQFQLGFLCVQSFVSLELRQLSVSTTGLLGRTIAKCLD